ncbi:MCE family protein [Nocardioides limicola]|uniref:MCE family protein n=1 Tax=Nocardioides limicola TaxID=2803368 RepID=UPI00193C4203|nr:MCE family protein [Nocardioides sp. DJM-14]
MKLNKHHALGLVFCALLLIGGGLVWAQFTNKFASFERVSLETSKVGLQLPSRADIKVRGVIVGEVLDVTTEENGAVIGLGIFPEHIDTIPSNVTGSIEPKTLFGEKYVNLVIPSDPSSSALQDGDVITRTEVAIEVEQVLNDLFPLLRAVQPADLNLMLNAIATALEGQGNDLGDNLETLDSYLKRMNPQVDPLVEDLRLTAEMADLYADVFPEIAQILRNQIVTLGTLEEREQRLNTLFTDVAAFSGTAERFLDDNRDNMVRLGRLGVQQLRLLERYSPIYPCLLEGLVTSAANNAEAFRNYTLHINLQLLPVQPRGYTPDDAPRYGARNGPDCLTLPNPPYNQQNKAPWPGNFDDGIDRPTGKGSIRVPTGFDAALLDSAAGFVGSEAEAELLRSILSPVLGVGSADVPDLGLLLLAPMARGAEVNLR